MKHLAQTQCKCGIETEVCNITTLIPTLKLTTFVAAPQPTPKHFTDEELKQQYGIHLATRLQADGDGKEAKWADIDDDEDDWAPETIEWNDGTKITLSQNDSAAILAEQEAVAQAARERQEEESKAKAAAQQRTTTTTVGPNATVLKPRSALQSKPSGLVLKNPSEKQSLVSKPTTTTPARSPWASLPPVERVPPVAINPPTQSNPFRTQQNDLYGSNSMPPPPPPAVEIAADDFTRTRRDTQNGNLGQLYNAQSGRYEPANTGRRGSVRKDQNARPPSLLQRGSATDQHGPAEPSAAFQTHRSSSQQDTALWTRRASSNMSDDSGPQLRRLSMGKSSSEMHQGRRVSQQSQALQSPTTPAFGQASLARDSTSSQQLPQSALQSPAVQHSQIHPIDPSSQTRDDVAVQKQLMKEKREMAIKRKREEEEREEAAKKERIRLKMEAMGMEPLSQKKELAKKEPRTEIEKRPSETAKVEQREAPKKVPVQDGPQVAKQPLDVHSMAPKSPPKPPTANGIGGPQQYGLMKVHGPLSNNVSPPGNERLNVGKLRPQPHGQKILPPGLEPKTGSDVLIPPPLVNGVKHADHLIQRAPDTSNQNLVRESRSQPWNDVSRDTTTFAGWNGQTTTRDSSTASNNVWGAPSQSRALGNGTFDRSVQIPQARQQEPFASSALAPIGPPKHLQSSREMREVGKANDASSAVMEDFQTIPTFPPSEAPPPIGKSDLMGRPPSEDHKASPPRFATGQQPRHQSSNQDLGLRGPEQQRSIVAAWGNFHTTSAREDAEKSRILAQQHAARLAEEARTGVRYEPQLPIMNETWRQVKVDDQSTQRSIISVSRAQNVHEPHTIGDIRDPSFANSMGTAPPMVAAGIGRGSRFFPTAGRGIQPHYQPPPPFTPGYRRGSSPPPPDSMFHPVFAREQARPLVKLPTVPPKPKVRLPPSLVTPVQSPKMADAQPLALRTASQPLINNPSWQDRFNGLLGVKKSPEKTFAHISGPAATSGFSATKEPLDLPPMQAPAAVSLPPQGEQSSALSSLRVDSKDISDEEALFDEPEAGSLPVVLLPVGPSDGGWSSAKPSKRGPSKQLRTSKEIEPVSKEELVDSTCVASDGIMVFVRILGMTLPKSKPMRSLSGQNPALASPRQRHFSGNTKAAKGLKSRESSGNTNNQRKTRSGPQRTAQQNGPNPDVRAQPSKNLSRWDSHYLT